MKLKDPTLLRRNAFIDGQWTPADNGATFPVHDPFDGTVIAKIADVGAAETDRAIAAAHQAFPDWRDRTAADRSAILHHWYALVHEHADDLALLMTREQGKPLAESHAEVTYGASFIEWFAEEGKRAYGDVIPAHKKDVRILALKQPVGVVAAITPWNFPIAMITRKVAPALAVGCTAVVKPAEDTPLCALALAELGRKAGIPPGVLNILCTSDPAQVGEVLCADERVRKLSFTGSTEVGRQLMAACAPTLKKLSLELGGNAPFIVFPDADIEGAVAGAMDAKYRNGGQTCIAANRFFIYESIYQKFTEALATKIDALRVGRGMEAGTDVGPLINDAAVKKVERLLRQATESGATIRVGGRLSETGPRCYAPTLLLDATPEMDISREEVFGPVAVVYKFSTEGEAIRLANATPYGLAAYFFGRDHAMIWRVAEALEYGMVGINTGLISTAQAPFGGVKQSGFGREGSRYGLEEYLVVKYLCWSTKKTVPS